MCSRGCARPVCPVVDADVLAREVVAPGTPGLAAVVEAFRPGDPHADGTLDRAAAGQHRVSATRRAPRSRGHRASRRSGRESMQFFAALPAADAVCASPTSRCCTRPAGERQFDKVIVVACAPRHRSRVSWRATVSRARTPSGGSRRSCRSTRRWRRADYVIHTDGSYDRDQPRGRSSGGAVERGVRGGALTTLDAAADSAPRHRRRPLRARDRRPRRRQASTAVVVGGRCRSGDPHAGGHVSCGRASTGISTRPVLDDRAVPRTSATSAPDREPSRCTPTSSTRMVRARRICDIRLNTVARLAREGDHRFVAALMTAGSWRGERGRGRRVPVFRQRSAGTRGMPAGRKLRAHLRRRWTSRTLPARRCLIVGGRQSAFEWAALLADAGAARVDLTYRHDTPQFTESHWEWAGALVDRFVDEPAWFRRLSQPEREALAFRFWSEGRLKLEPWLSRVCAPTCVTIAATDRDSLRVAQERRGCRSSSRTAATP